MSCVVAIMPSLVRRKPDDHKGIALINTGWDGLFLYEVLVLY
jgi:hypothetical protein